MKTDKWQMENMENMNSHPEFNFVNSIEELIWR
jgi:hypothetical protein